MALGKRAHCVRNGRAGKNFEAGQNLCIHLVKSIRQGVSETKILNLVMRKWLSGRALPCLRNGRAGKNFEAGQNLCIHLVKSIRQGVSETKILNLVMRKWLSGRALPCQGKCREFESRLPLQKPKILG